MFLTFFKSIIYRLNIFFEFLAKIILTFSPFILTFFLIPNSHSPRSDIELIVLFFSALLSLALFLKFIKNRKQTYISLFILVISCVASLFYTLQSSNLLSQVVFKVDSNIWNNLYSTWSVMLIFAVAIFFIALQEFDVYKKLFNFIIILQVCIFLINFIYLYFGRSILNYEDFTLRLQVHLFSDGLVIGISFVIIVIIILSYLLKLYTEKKRYINASVDLKYIKYLYLVFFFIYFYLFFYQALQYFIFKRLNNIFIDANNLTYVVPEDILQDIRSIKKFYSNDTILLIENKFIDIERKELLLKLLEYQNKIPEEYDNITEKYVENINKQIINAKNAIFFNHLNYRNHLELAYAYEKVAILLNKDTKAYENSMERYKMAFNLKNKDKDEISVMMAKLELSRLDKTLEQRDQGFLFYINQALSMNPYSKTALEALILFEKERNLDIALKKLSVLLEKYQHDKDVHKFAIIFYFDTKDYKNTIHYSLKYLDTKDKNDKIVIFYLFQSLYFNNNLEEAKNIYNALIKNKIKEYSIDQQSEINNIWIKL